MPCFTTLASSSSGNASCFRPATGGGLLLDCGIPLRRLTAGLTESGFAPESLNGVLLTHEHIDHTRGLLPFLKKYRLPLYASKPVLNALAAQEKLPPDAICIPVERNTTFSVGEMAVTAFATSHDSVGALCYSISFGDRSAAVLTDTGFVSDEMLAAVQKADLVLLESNYDPDLLRTGHYPYPLKKRIEGRLGHLSNRQAADAAGQLLTSGATRFILCHLSRDNNRPALAKAACEEGLRSMGAENGVDYLLSVAPPDRPLPVCIF